MKKHLIVAAGLSMLVTSLALAQMPGTATPQLDQRQQQQEQRIQQGVQSGALTPQEAGRLEQGQDRLQRMENKAKADGVVTKKERVLLNQAADQQSRQIARQKHDRQHDLNHDGRRDRPLRGN